MSNEKTLKQITEAFSQSLGEEAALRLIQEASVKAGLSIKEAYSGGEVLKIYETIEAERKDFARTIAGFLIAEILCSTKDMKRINTLIIGLQSAKFKLETLSEQLEEKVNERTREVKEVNEELKKNNEQLIEEIVERKKAEENLLKTQEQLKKKVEDLGKFNKIAVNREIKMIELKEEINNLMTKLGREGNSE
ncbi:MAG: hypothetical protein KKG84_05230 [Candidatus Omnitrophica bacterium]|nr:hypothetical protein [Candidatus Omnitrophota bacterium]